MKQCLYSFFVNNVQGGCADVTDKEVIPLTKQLRLRRLRKTDELPCRVSTRRNRRHLKFSLPIILIGTLASALAAQSAELVIAPDPQGQTVDMTNYGLGQGGLSDKPMLAPHTEDLGQLHPKHIRLFVQEYYDLMPAKGKYDWTKLDRELESIVATGAKPFLSLCMKPAVLFPKVDHTIVHPTSYQEWEEFIEQLVRHVNGARKFGVEYWEIGNEVEIVECGGCPYLFTPEDYLVYYTHTVQAVLRADPKVKVGGPALGTFNHPIGDALLAYAAQGKAPLNFFSWHTYDDNPDVFRQRIRDVKARIAKHPQLKDVETYYDEWNISLNQVVPGPGFQCAFLLTVTKAMQEEGLTGANYYHIRDVPLAVDAFRRFMSPTYLEPFDRFWSALPVRLGLYDQQGRIRPAYYVFKMLAQMRGKQWKAASSDPRLFGMAVENGPHLEILFWNFVDKGESQPMDVQLRVDTCAGKPYKLIQFNPASSVDNLEYKNTGLVPDPSQPPLQVQLEPYGIRWLTIDR
ncbi:MAG: hypothetical protein HZB26_13210 [Candidatus Hydrogenedentes bacterium]|nr:hypothetical protein [Candidatus Hydrogenedentota bacterium]